MSYIGLKLLTYCLFGVILKQVYGATRRGAITMVVLRTALGIGAGLFVWMLSWWIPPDWSHSQGRVLIGDRQIWFILALLAPAQIWMWWFSIHTALGGRPRPRKEELLLALGGALPSWFLDLAFLLTLRGVYFGLC